MDKNSKVSIVKCTDYSELKINSAIDKTFELFGGIQNVIKNRARVLIKPNFLQKSLPEKCIVTHPSVIKSIARKLLEVDAIPVIGDSPAFGSVHSIIKCIGLDEFVKENNISVIELDDPRKVEMRYGMKLFPFTVSGKALDIDAIINVPKLKAHVQLLFTGAIKNMYGCVSGKRKVWRHFKSKGDLGWFSDMLLANYLTLRPVFTVVDAVVAMEKQGPTNGTPRDVSLIIGGIDCVAIDRIIAEIVNVDSKHVPVLRRAKEHNVGEQELDKIEILGEQLSTVKLSNYELPELISIEFNILRIAKSVIKNLLIKKFKKAA